MSGTGRVQCDRRVHPVVPAGRVDDPARGVQIVGDGDRCLNADRFGAVEDRAHVVGGAGPTGIEVGVGVDQGAKGSGAAVPVAYSPQHNKVKLK